MPVKKIKTVFLLVTGILLSYAGFSQDLVTQISVDFKIRNLGFNVDGVFNKATTTTNFKAKDVSQWELSGSVKVNSINTGIEKRDAHLLEEAYFDANTYPEIQIEGTNFKTVSENNYNVTIKLTIKKTTKIMTIPMEIIKDDEWVTLKTYFEINRRDFGVGGGSLVLSNTVKINVNYTLKKE